MALAITTSGARDQPESASVTMSKGYDKGMGFGVGTIQQYYLLPSDATCRHKKSLAIFSALTGKSVTKPIPAGAPVNIYASVQRITSFGGGVCQNNVSFTPIAGHNYSVLQRSAVWQSCNIEVIDMSTNLTPLDLKQDNSVECVETEKRQGPK